MARSNPGFEKRLREQKKRQKKAEKAQKKAERDQAKADGTWVPDDEGVVDHRELMGADDGTAAPAASETDESEPAGSSASTETRTGSDQGSN